MVNNFKNIAENILRFINPNDRYVIHIMTRKKDVSQASSNSTIIKDYYIDDKVYFFKKQEEIKSLCKLFNARAYISVQPKDNVQCMLQLSKLIVDSIQNDGFDRRPDKLVREAYCGFHRTVLKRWILDLDFDGEFKPEDVKPIEEFIHSLHEKAGQTNAEIIRNPTKNGMHLICTPFNLNEAQKTYPMMYEGNKNGKCGWLKKDAMTILYVPIMKKKKEKNNDSSNE